VFVLDDQADIDRGAEAARDYHAEAQSVFAA
jgi:hypothetical protein